MHLQSFQIISCRHGGAISPQVTSKFNDKEKDFRRLWFRQHNLIAQIYSIKKFSEDNVLVYLFLKK